MIAAICFCVFFCVSAVHLQDVQFSATECEVKKLALEFGKSRLQTNVNSLEEALHFESNCTHSLWRDDANERRRRRGGVTKQEKNELEIGFYVATNGSDTNSGSIAEPFATLHRAQAQVRTLLTGGLGQPQITVFVRAGKYFLDETFTLTSEDSGYAYAPIIYRPYEEETVTLSGAMNLGELDWKPGDDHVMMAKLSSPISFDSFFVNGRRQVRARFPNGDPQEQSGLCFSKSQYDGEGCPGYLQATGGTGSFPSPESIAIDIDKPKRGGHVAGDDHFPNFHYAIYNPPFQDEKFPSVYSFWGNPYVRPNGFKYDSKTWTNKTWSHPETGIVHMFHSGLWGNWMYTIDEVNKGNSTVMFGRGGWQEARGSGIRSNHFYVENVFEELDAPGEWYLDVNSSMLYFYPNATQLRLDASNEYAAPVLQRLVAFVGTAANPVQHIRFEGFHITETAVTFMEPYEVPSGGDWSIHRGGAVFLDGAENIDIVNCTFDQTGGNAVFLSNHVKNCTVMGNEFRFTGDSAIAAVGTSASIDGTTTSQYPSRNIIANNHIHDIGVYGKQTSCYFQSIACGNIITDNVCYNGPRAGINFNDGFGGTNHVFGNLLFNMVRETGDHGPFNSWDRQPYVTPMACDVGPPSIVPQPTNITGNFIINGYNGVWSLDHDDGSAHYNDSNNFLVYGGCKNYLGHDKACGPGNVILFPGINSRSSGGRRCQTDDNGQFANQYYFGNTCFEPDGNFYSFHSCDYEHLSDTVYQTWNNTFYSPNATFMISCGKDLDFDSWQKLGQDQGSSVHDLPSPADIVAMGRKVLGL